MMTRFAAEELICMPESIRENSFTERHNNSIPQNNITNPTHDRDIRNMHHNGKHRHNITNVSRLHIGPQSYHTITVHAMSQGQSFGLQHGYKSTTADWHTSKDSHITLPTTPYTLGSSSESASKIASPSSSLTGSSSSSSTSSSRCFCKLI